MTSIRNRQMEALKQMLNFNQPLGGDNNELKSNWMLLIYDRTGQDIIAPLFNVKELSELGVTLHLLINSTRTSIANAPAVYFCEPNDQNLSLIKKDFEQNLYGSYYFNFISPISRKHLEALTEAAFFTNSVSKVQKVFDQFLNFVCLENDLFVLKQHQSHDVSYYALNRHCETDDDIERTVDIITNGILSVFVTMGNVPIIRSSRNNAAEMIAQRLDKKIRDNYFDARSNLFQINTTSGNFNFQRPVLIILDRNLDLATPLHHPWIYQALIHDLLNLSLNRIVMKSQDAKGNKQYDFNNNKDKFWLSHKGSPFPTVAEAIQEELDKYKASETEVKKLKEIINSNENGENLNENTAKLSSAVNSIPELLETKRFIDMHTNIATEILNLIKSRKLDTLFEFEEKIMSSLNVEKNIAEILNDADVSANDKLRLLLIYFICTTDVTSTAFEALENTLRNQNYDLSALAYLKQWKKAGKLTEMNLNYDSNAIRTVNMFSKIVSKGSTFLMEGVKNLVVKQNNLPITKIVDQLIENKSSKEVDDYLYLDPKQLKNTDGNRTKLSFEDVYVFVVGGGNYIEYHNLLAYSKQKSQSGKTKNITYGTTSLENAESFLKQLNELGKKD